MSLHRQVWYQAVKANQKMQIAQEDGQNTFNEMLEKFPNDGMIFYERAEAYESLGNLNLAKEDYQKAFEKFPLDHWKNIAKLGIDRTQQKIEYSYYKDINDQWGVFHRIHSLNKLPHDIRCHALSAIERFDAEIESFVSELRLLLEEIVNYLSRKLNNNFEISKKLSKKIDWLEKNKKISERASNLMDNLNKWGNDSIHWEKINEDIRQEVYLANLYELLEYANNNF